MMAGRLAWEALALPLSMALGVVCAAVALAYARCAAAGSAIDGTTLRVALRQGLAWRAILHVPTRLGLLCAVLLAMACLPFALQPSVAAAARAAACAVLLVLAIIDARTRLLPDALTLPLLWAGLLLAWTGAGVSLHDAIAAAVAGYVSLCALNAGFRAWRGRAGMGGGDIKLVAALGAWLGWEPLPGVLLAACIAGILFAVGRRRRRGRRAWRVSQAFGPFLALAGGFGLVGGPVVQFLFCLGNAVCTRLA